MTTHSLKILPDFYDAVVSGAKRAEVRKNDRGFQVGDFLRLNEWDDKEKRYTGRQFLARVTYIVPGGQFGVEAGYVCMSII